MTNAELSNLSVEELRVLNTKVVQMINMKQRMASAIKIDGLHKGMRVMYTGRNKVNGETFIIDKVNKVNVVCTSEKTGIGYRIPAASLKIVEKEKA